MVRRTTHSTDSRAMTRDHRRLRSRWPLIAVLTAQGLAAAAACSTDPGAWEPGPASPGEPAASCQDGAHRDCGITLGVQGDVVACYLGTQICEDAVWGACEDGHLVSHYAPAVARRTALRPRSLSDPIDCESNPCDPNCQIFWEEPDASIGTPEGDPVFTWQSGNLGDYPSGLVNKGIVTPCNSGYDCQFGYQCIEPVTHPDCAHSKCEVGTALASDCEASYGALNAPSCVELICDAMPGCCDTSYSGSCDHNPCETGVALKVTCESCLATVCASEPGCCGISPGSTTDPMVLEAEEATNSAKVGGLEFVEITDATASSGRAMEVADKGTGNSYATGYDTKSPWLEFDVDFPSDGRWYVWVRGQAGGATVGTSDTCHVGLDATPTSSAEALTGFGSDWTWSATTEAGAVAYMDVATAGAHTVNLWMYEDGFLVDRVVLTQDATYAPSGVGPSVSGVSAWTDTCVNLYESACGVSCGAGDWTQDCVDAVATVCDATCGESPPADCTHAVCETGEGLDAGCHPCAAEVCKVDPFCCIDTWDDACVTAVDTYCSTSCPVEMVLPPVESGQCIERLPGEVDESCDTIDLAVGVPCGGTLPICNHGTETAPKGIRIVHFPANSQQYPATDPDQTHPGMVECATSEVIPSGHCINVDDCSDLGGNREIMINPGGEVTECSSLDNWSLYSTGSECEMPVCSKADASAAFADLHLYFVVEKSAAMNTNSMWTNTASALEAFFASEDAAGMQVSLEFFPLASGSAEGDGCADTSVGSCDSGPCSTAMVPGAFLTSETGATDPQETALLDALAAVTAGGGSPLYPALDGALDRAVADQASDPSAAYAVVLVSPGNPDTCETSSRELARLAIDAYVNSGVLTYTIALDETDTTTLDLIARSGGTRRAFPIPTESLAEELLATLNTIAATKVRCEFDVRNAANINVDNATLTYTPGDKSAAVDLALVSGSGACGDGWYFDDLDNPTTATLCPATCDAVQADEGALLELVVGCTPTYEGAEYSEIYNGVCTTGGLQWAFFTYATEIDAGAEILFEARTATSEAGLASASWVTIATASNDLQTCGLGGPLPACPVSLYDALGGGPDSRLPFLELRATLSPSSSGLAKAILNRWQITYSCPDNE